MKASRPSHLTQKTQQVSVYVELNLSCFVGLKTLSSTCISSIRPVCISWGLSRAILAKIFISLGFTISDSLIENGKFKIWVRNCTQHLINKRTLWYQITFKADLCFIVIYNPKTINIIITNTFSWFLYWLPSCTYLRYLRLKNFFLKI